MKKKKLNVKVISALILIAICIPIIWIGGIVFQIFVCLLALLGLKEIIDLKKGADKYPLIVVLMAVFNLLLIMISGFVSQKNALSINSAVLAFTLLSMFIPVVIKTPKSKYNSNDALYLTGTVFLLGIAFSTLFMLIGYNVWYIVYLLLITVGTDTFAQFGGKLFGKHKLTALSPKKTWEGSICGTIVGSLVASLFYMLVIGNTTLIICILLTILFSIIAQIGDLFFSAIKRLNEIKDFSNIIPGHGGILDRLDSLIFVLLAFAIFIAKI